MGRWQVMLAMLVLLSALLGLHLLQVEPQLDARPAAQAQKREAPKTAPASPGETREAQWLRTWPAGKRSNRAPLSPFNFGTYANAGAAAIMADINRWYRAGTAAGYDQDAFRSYCGGHSRLRTGDFPGLRRLEASNGANGHGALRRPAQTVFADRVTYGVRSHGMSGPVQLDDGLVEVVEYDLRTEIRRHYRGETPASVPALLSRFYRGNFLLTTPAVGNYKAQSRDTFSFMTPYLLHSIGTSGTDAMLLRPVIIASAALRPELKLRALRRGALTPTLLMLFRQHYAGGLDTTAGHEPAYTPPAEADEGASGETPLLRGLVDAAHALQHIPPITELSAEVTIERGAGADYDRDAYLRVTPHLVAAVLRPGETLRATVDVGAELDEGKRLARRTLRLLRGPGTVTPVADAPGRFVIEVPWTPTLRGGHLRTDIAAVAHDDATPGAPAYLSIKHVQPAEAEALGIR